MHILCSNMTCWDYQYYMNLHCQNAFKQSLSYMYIFGIVIYNQFYL